MHCLYYPPEVGGLESHVHHLARGLVEEGHRVSVVTSRSVPGTPGREDMDGVDVWRTWFVGRHPAGWVASALAAAPRMRALAAQGVDIVHAQDFASVVPSRSAARAAGAPLVTTHHTSHFLRRAARRRWRPVLARLVRAADYNLAASREIADVAASLAPGTDVEALPNGVDTRLFRPVPASLDPVHGFRLVVPRRLYPKNGVEHFIRAMPGILEQLPATRAVLIGDGPERAALEALARELDVADRIDFLGARPHDEMAGLLCSGALAVFPSLMEATSVAALECMACGVPVAASRVGGLPEIVDGDVGGLFEPGDPNDLARVVVELLLGRDLEALGRTARARVQERWSNRRLVARHVEIYESLLRQGSA